MTRELWQQALLDRNARAWQVIYHEYSKLVQRWVKAQLRFPVDAPTLQTLVDDAFLKMAGTFTRHPEKFADYPNLAALLGLLRCCAQRVVQDYVSALPRELPLVAWDEIREPAAPPAPAHSEIQSVLAGLLVDEKEWLVVTELLIETGKPRQLYQEQPGRFRDVNEINTIRERVKTRLQRNDAFRRHLQRMAGE
jgi:DNA-directed RNA polymerase specialized sigma24 family protein